MTGTRPPRARRRNGRWAGAISHRGRRYWVGTFATRRQWLRAAGEVHAQLANRQEEE